MRTLAEAHKNKWMIISFAGFGQIKFWPVLDTRWQHETKCPLFLQVLFWWPWRSFAYFLAINLVAFWEISHKRKNVHLMVALEGQNQVAKVRSHHYHCPWNMNARGETIVKPSLWHKRATPQKTSNLSRGGVTCILNSPRHPQISQNITDIWSCL